MSFTQPKIVFTQSHSTVSLAQRTNCYGLILSTSYIYFPISGINFDLRGVLEFVIGSTVYIGTVLRFVMV